MPFADELRLGWNTPSVRTLLRKLILDGIFRYDPPLGEAVLARIDAGVAGLQPSAELYDDLHAFLKSPEHAAAFQKLFQGDEAARIERRVGQLVKLLPIGWRPGSFVDVGCGNALVTAGLARHWNLPREHVVGVEVFDRSLARAAVTLLPFADHHLPLGDASQDLALLIMVLHHHVDQIGLLRDIARVLKPGGRLVVRETDAFRVDLRLFNQVMEMMYYRVFNQLPGIPNPVLHRSAAEWEFDFAQVGFVVEKLERPEPDNPFTPVHYVLRRP